MKTSLAIISLTCLNIFLYVIIFILIFHLMFESIFLKTDINNSLNLKSTECLVLSVSGSMNAPEYLLQYQAENTVYKNQSEAATVSSDGSAPAAVNSKIDCAYDKRNPNRIVINNAAIWPIALAEVILIALIFYFKSFIRQKISRLDNPRRKA